MPRSFLRELKRRKVYRVAVGYAIVGWLLIQIATQVFPFFHIPDWTVRVLVLLVLAGFPIALVLAWAFDVTPQGIQRTDAEGQPVLRRSRRGTIAVGAIGVLIAILVGVGYWGWHREAPAVHPPKLAAARSPDAAQRNPGVAIPDSAATAAASGLRNARVQAVPIPEKSVAVLPFVNESGDKSQQYFSDGLSEDLITALSQFSGLKVISRDSAFQFRASKDSSKLIGEKLGVAHLLEGSVQRAGDEVRITATLVNAADGSILWSQRYDKPYKDLFKLQDDITKSVAGALKVKLLTANGAVVQSDRPPNENLDAYTAYQHGVAYFALGTEVDDRKAIDFFDKAIQIDSRYVQAYAALSHTWTYFGGLFLGGAQQQQAYAKARAATDTALLLDPDSAAVHMSHGYLLVTADFDWTGGEAEYRRALQLAPSSAVAKFGLGSLLATLGQPEQAVELTRQALASDPRNVAGYISLGAYLNALGRLDEAERAIHAAIALRSGASTAHFWLTVTEILRGNAGAALAAAQQESPGPWHDIAVTLALQIGGDHAAADAALKKLIDKDAGTSAYQIAEVYALRQDPGNMFEWLDRAWANRDAGIGFLLYDPLILRYRDDPRFAAFCKKVGLPTTTDAKPMP